MPIEYEIDSASKLVTARVTGILTHDDINGYQHDVWTRPELEGFDEIVDVSEVESIAYESGRRVSETASLAASTDSKKHPSRLAIVAITPVAYGLARMYQTYRETTPGSTKLVKVVRSLAEAHEWVGK
jgi:hypothetical protein